MCRRINQWPTRTRCRGVAGSSPHSGASPPRNDPSRTRRGPVTSPHGMPLSPPAAGPGQTFGLAMTDPCSHRRLSGPLTLDYLGPADRQLADRILAILDDHPGADVMFIEG